MAHIKLHQILMGLAMCLAAWLAVVLHPTKKLADQSAKISLEQMIPKQFGDWKMDASAEANVKPSAEVQANLDKIYDQILNRSYLNSRGERMMLTITYGSSQTQDLKAHRQEVCYAAQGFTIMSIKHPVLQIAQQNVPSTQMFAIKQDRKEPVTYWFTMGDNVVLSRLERLLVAVKYAFAGVIPDGVLVRVSSLTPDAEQGYQAQLSFMNELMRTIDKKAAQKLLGGAPAQG
jgi:EpsI family protein